jgi:hypothetical protein
VVGTAGFEPATPCSQSQIGQGRHLRRRGAAQVEVALVLSVAVRSGPVKTVVNGTLVARRRGRTWLKPGGDGHQLDRRVRPVPADHLPRWQAAEGGAAGLSVGDGAPSGSG